jgi:MFS family permease
MCIQIILSFISFIIKDPKYYNVSNDIYASEMGYIASIAELVVIFFDIILGPIMDKIGRKIPIIVGFTCISIAMALIPLFT